MLKNHLLNPYLKIEQLLLEDKIDFSNYLFLNKENKLVPIDFSESEFYLIDFWFVNCPPCIKDHRIIKNKQEWLKNNNIQLIGISTDTDQEKWNNYLNKEKYNWANYREQEKYNRKITTKLLINTFPTYLLIDKNGKILRRSNSFSEIEDYLEK
jgi:alkyl hydroperoxide reductase subunit AhpC